MACARRDLRRSIEGIGRRGEQPAARRRLRDSGSSSDAAATNLVGMQPEFTDILAMPDAQRQAAIKDPMVRARISAGLAEVAPRGASSYGSSTSSRSRKGVRRRASSTSA